MRAVVEEIKVAEQEEQNQSRGEEQMRALVARVAELEAHKRVLVDVCELLVDPAIWLVSKPDMNIRCCVTCTGVISMQDDDPVANMPHDSDCPVLLARQALETVRPMSHLAQAQSYHIWQ